MIRKCTNHDFNSIYAIINDAAQAYKGVIPEDCWKEPYMCRDELSHEIGQGVQFWGYDDNGELIGVMGMQNVLDVTLIRHAYVLKSKQKTGIGGKLLEFLRRQTSRPILIGTWEAAFWAVHFYERHGFNFVPQREKEQLLKKYWSVPDRQIETSVVLAETYLSDIQECAGDVFSDAIVTGDDFVTS